MIPTRDNKGNSFTGFAPSGSTLCPRCTYDLSGLPADYQCPECGFTYDEYTMIWTRIRPTVRVPWQHSIEAIPTILIFSILIWQAPTIFGINRWLLIFFLIGLATAAFRLLRGPRSLCLTPSGVEIYPRGLLGPTLITWRDVGVTHRREDSYYLTRMTRSQSINISVFFERPDEHQDFEAALNELRERYR